MGQTSDGSWRAGGRMLFGIHLVLVAALVAGSPGSCTGTATPDEPRTEGSQEATVRAFAAAPAAVIDALVAALQERGELAEPAATDYRNALATELSSGSVGRLSSASVDIDQSTLRGLVREDVQKYVTSAGGRYTLDLTVEGDPAGGTRVGVRSVFVSNVDQGPLGGRVLPSNGTLESNLLAAVATRLR